MKKFSILKLKMLVVVLIFKFSVHSILSMQEDEEKFQRNATFNRSGSEVYQINIGYEDDHFKNKNKTDDQVLQYNNWVNFILNENDGNFYFDIDSEKSDFLNLIIENTNEILNLRDQCKSKSSDNIYIFKISMGNSHNKNEDKTTFNVSMNFRYNHNIYMLGGPTVSCTNILVNSETGETQEVAKTYKKEARIVLHFSYPDNDLNVDNMKKILQECSFLIERRFNKIPDGLNPFSRITEFGINRYVN